MKIKLLKKKKFIWKIKLLLFVFLVIQTIFILLVPVFKGLQSQKISQRQHNAYTQTVDDLTPTSQQDLAQYEEEYNEYLMNKIRNNNFEIARPSKDYYKQTKGIMGFLSAPNIGLKDTTIGYNFYGNKDTPFVQQYLSSLPGSNNDMSCILVRLKSEWRFQNIVSLLDQIKKEDILFFETYHGKEQYEVIKSHTYTTNNKEYRHCYRKKEKYFVVQYRSPTSGDHEIIMKKKSKRTEKNLNIKRRFFSYSMGVSFFLIFIGGAFIILVFCYRHKIDKFLTGKERVRQTTRKNLYLLLQITKAYLLLVGLASVFFLIFIVYTYGLH
ncbi:hypothetical protein [Enterococcus sp. AZ007]|uniref:hypothetical protein n=1 Tax=Enterococcus sp. AZ007 TaxID=2774839 RepID=UPI003F206BD7